MGQEASEKGGSHDRARVVRRYLSALDARKPGRTAARTVESVAHRIHQIDTLLLSADPVKRLHLTQERIDLHAEQLRLQTSNGGDFEALEKGFVRVARTYGDRHSVTYSAWRQVGVDAGVLAQAGIHQQVKPARPQSSASAAAPKAVAPTTEAPTTEAPTAVAPTAVAPAAVAPAAEAPVASPVEAAKAPNAKKPGPGKKAPAAKKVAVPAEGGDPKQAKKTAAKPKAEAQPEQQQLSAEVTS